MKSVEDVVIVGGSLSGLTLALACADRGIQTKVLERSGGQHRSGAALGIDRALLLRAIGLIQPRGGHDVGFPVLAGDRNAASWSAIHGWLLGRARRWSGIKFLKGCTVLNVTQSKAAATLHTTDGERINAAVVIGADGYRSVVRAAIIPAAPDAMFAGYVLWRGLVGEREMPSQTNWPVGNSGVALVHTDGFRLVAYPVAGSDGSLQPGRRRISFAWYDPTRDALLQSSGCISQSRHVLASLPRTRISDQVRQELRRLAQRIWPAPWRDFIIHALERREVFATPVAEYFPERLHNGRLVMLGDAAHVVSPMTGKGFLTGMADAGTLADCLAGGDLHSYRGVLSALKHYEDKRLREAQELASTSINWSRAYLKDVGFRRTGQSWPLRSL